MSFALWCLLRCGALSSVASTFLGTSTCSERSVESCLAVSPAQRGRKRVQRVPTANDIRQRAGALSSIRIPAKWAARLAQCFSTTQETITLRRQDVRLSSTPSGIT